MRKIVVPKKSHKGLKTFCKICRVNNPKCNHKDNLVYRVIIKVPGGFGSVRTKMLVAENYNDAVIEAIQFRKDLVANNFETLVPKIDEGNDFSVIGAILKYNQYLQGDTDFAHLKKSISIAYKDEIIRYCKLFAKNLKQTQDIGRMKITVVSKKQVGSFYTFLKSKYSPKTFNKCLNSLKGFFDFLIKVEDVQMKNPFETFIPQTVPNSTIEIITKEEFLSILNAIDTYNPKMILGGKGESKNMYYPWLKDGFRLFLLTGGRREEIVDLKWSNIFVSESGIKFLMFNNLKVERINRTKNTPKKYVPINADLEELLIELGLNENKSPDDYILFPNRDCTTKTIMDRLSKSFTHYKKGAGIEKNISFKNLRKTYITWVNQVMGNQTGILTSHSTNEVLEKFYLDPKVLSAVEKGATEIRIFGSKNGMNNNQKVTHKGDTKEKTTYEKNVSG
jgi:integrase